MLGSEKTHDDDSYLSSGPRSIQYSLADELISFAAGCCTNSDIALLRLTPKELERHLNAMEDQLVDNPSLLVIDGLYTEIKRLIGCLDDMNTGCKMKMAAMMVHVMASKRLMKQSQCRDIIIPIEQASLLTLIIMQYMEQICLSKKSSSSEDKESNHNSKVYVITEWASLRLPLVNACRGVTEYLLTNLSGSLIDSLVSTLVRIVHGVLEGSISTLSSSTELKKASIEALASLYRLHPGSSAIPSLFTQDLTFNEAMAEPLAELLSLVVSSSEEMTTGGVTPLMIQIFEHMPGLCSSDKTARVIGVFMVRLTQLCPREVYRHAAGSVCLALLDRDPYGLRMSMIEVLGLLCAHLILTKPNVETDENSLGDDENSLESKENFVSSARSLFDLILERTRDVSSFVRSKALHVFTDLCKASTVPVTWRPDLLALATSRLMDKSVNVRRRAVGLAIALLNTHPFGVDGGELNQSMFESRLSQLNAASEIQGEQEDDETRIISTNPNTLFLQRRYYQDALDFVKQMNELTRVMMNLVRAGNKRNPGHGTSSTASTMSSPELLMDILEFLVQGSIYGLEITKKGFRQMMPLIWTGNDNLQQQVQEATQPGSQLKEHLLQAFHRLFLCASDGNQNIKEQYVELANNLCTLVTSNLTLAELMSIQSILHGLATYRPGHKSRANVPSLPLIPFIGIVQALYHRLSVTLRRSESTEESLLGPLIVLSMLSNSMTEDEVVRYELLLQVLGISNDPLVALYVIKTLVNFNTNSSLNSTHPIIQTMISFVTERCRSPEWFDVINHVCRGIYSLCGLSGGHFACSCIIRSLVADYKISRTGDNLACLLHILGHVALCTVIQLDIQEKKGETIRQDKSLLLDHLLNRGLLAPFIPLIIQLAQAPNTDALLKVTSSIALFKIALVSEAACSTLLPVIKQVMHQPHTPATLRSTLIICIGDLIQCYGQSLLARGIDLAEQLLLSCLEGAHQVAKHDQDILDNDALLVSRHALMVITHLAMTGMLKIRGPHMVAMLAMCLNASRKHQQLHRVQDLALAFFGELAQKDDQAIYNLLPDFIAGYVAFRISSYSEEADDTSNFAQIMSILLSFVGKDRQIETLIDKLLSRLKTVSISVLQKQNPIGQKDQWIECRTLAHAINLIIKHAMDKHHSSHTRLHSEQNEEAHATTAVSQISSGALDRCLKRIIDALPGYSNPLIADHWTAKYFADLMARILQGKSGGSGNSTTVYASLAEATKVSLADYETTLLKIIGDQDVHMSDNIQQANVDTHDELIEPAVEEEIESKSSNSHDLATQLRRMSIEAVRGRTTRKAKIRDTRKTARSIIKPTVPPPSRKVISTRQQSRVGRHAIVTNWDKSDDDVEDDKSSSQSDDSE